MTDAADQDVPSTVPAGEAPTVDDAPEAELTPAELTPAELTPAELTPAELTPAEPITQATGDPNAVLLNLIDRVADLLLDSDLTEIEVESGRTGLVLRKSVALQAVGVGAVSSVPQGGEVAAGAVSAGDPVPGVGGAIGVPASAGREPAPPSVPSIKAPLTGIFWASPAPGTAPYVRVGGEVAIGQVIGLIEAMKLFNEIKSDLAGRVIRVVAEGGALVKAKQPLIEVEPL